MLAQVVLTLGFVFFYRDDFVLITAERNRVYAVTRKNRIIASCLGATTISQFILGLYLTAYAATRERESVIKCHQLFLPTSMLQRYSSHGPHFRILCYATRYTAARGYSISHHVSRTRYDVSLIPHLGDTHSGRLVGSLAFSAIDFLVVGPNIYKVSIPSLLRTIARGGTCYFLVIFTSHLVLVIFMAFTSVRISS